MTRPGRCQNAECRNTADGEQVDEHGIVQPSLVRRRRAIMDRRVGGRQVGNGDDVKHDEPGSASHHRRVKSLAHWIVEVDIRCFSPEVETTGVVPSAGSRTVSAVWRRSPRSPRRPPQPAARPLNSGHVAQPRLAGAEIYRGFSLPMPAICCELGLGSSLVVTGRKAELHTPPPAAVPQT